MELTEPQDVNLTVFFSWKSFLKLGCVELLGFERLSSETDLAATGRGESPGERERATG